MPLDQITAAEESRCGGNGKLEHVILPLFNHDRPAFIDVMRHCIALNGSFFNTQRMMHQYVVNAYFR